MKNPFSKVRLFFIEMIDELKKATWPTGNELRDSTVVVLAASVLLGIFTSISDFSVSEVVKLLADMVR